MKYVISVEDPHVRTLMRACEAYARLGMGQLSSVAAFCWTSELAAGMDRDTLQEFDQILCRRLGWPPGQYLGIGSERVHVDHKRAWDMYRVVNNYMNDGSRDSVYSVSGAALPMIRQQNVLEELDDACDGQT